MKKQFLLFTVAAAFAFTLFTSYKTGPGSHQYNCSGADVSSGSGNPNGCTNCHGSSVTTGITVSLTVDSVGGVPVTSYVPGMTYTVTLTGTNTTTHSLPKFGFQVSATVGAAAAAVPVDAGVLQSSGLPAGVHYVAAPRSSSTFYASVVEHNTLLSPTSGTGATGTVYSESFTWTAPAAGTGIISFFAAFNAVNGTGNESGDYWNVIHNTLNEIVSSTSAGNVLEKATGMNIYPNPSEGRFTMELSSIDNNATIMIVDMMGKLVDTRFEQNINNRKIDLDLSNLPKGIYLLKASTGLETFQGKVTIR